MHARSQDVELGLLAGPGTNGCIDQLEHGTGEEFHDRLQALSWGLRVEAVISHLVEDFAERACQM